MSLDLPANSEESLESLDAAEKEGFEPSSVVKTSPERDGTQGAPDAPHEQGSRA